MRMVGGILLLLAASAAAQAPGGFRLVANMHQLMVGVVAPASDVLFKYPTGGDAPENEEDWNRVRNSSLLVAETGNLLILPGRAKDKGDWLKYAKALTEAGASGFKAAEAKNADALGAASDALAETCENCHKKYLQR